MSSVFVAWLAFRSETETSSSVKNSGRTTVLPGVSGDAALASSDGVSLSSW